MYFFGVFVIVPNFLSYRRIKDTLIGPTQPNNPPNGPSQEKEQDCEKDS